MRFPVKNKFLGPNLLERKDIGIDIKEHDFLRELKFPPFSSMLRASVEKGGNSKSRKEI